jgi:periplasmic protein TonB
VAPASAPAHLEASHAASAPAPATTFTFGGANTPEQSSGGNKKIFIGLAAAVLVGALAYVGWNAFGNHGTATTPAPVLKPATPPSAGPSSATSSGTSSVPSTAPGTPSKPTASAEPAVDSTSPASSQDDADTQPADATPPPPVSTKPASAASSKSAAAASKPVEGPAPLVVKGGAAPSAKSQAPAPDAAAPSMIGIANPSSAAGMPNLGSAQTATPVLQRLNVSQGVSRGLLIKKVDPIYPPSAIHMKIEGPVELSATISKGGDITGIKVISGNKQLTQAAMDAVKRWKYKPYLLNGEPVEIQTQITVIFKLPQ